MHGLVHVELDACRASTTKSCSPADLPFPRRLSTPLGDEAAMKIGRLFGQPSMMELVARARKRAVGSMFPSIFPEAGGSGRRAGPT